MIRTKGIFFGYYDTYKVLANITFWMVALLIARFVVRVIPRGRKLHKMKDSKPI
jgi:hypothetical protein